MCGRIIGALLAVAGMFVLVVDLYKSFPSHPGESLPTIEIPLWVWVDGWLPVLTSITTPDEALQDIPFVVAAFVVGGGIYLAVGPGKKSGKKSWEK